ncbi:unnamed protein product, partial [Didymodactylos carnosus]
QRSYTSYEEPREVIFRIIVADKDFVIHEVIFYEKPLIKLERRGWARAIETFLNIDDNTREKVLNTFYCPNDILEAKNDAMKIFYNLLDNESIKLNDQNTKEVISFISICNVNTHTINDYFDGLYEISSKFTHSCAPNIACNSADKDDNNGPIYFEAIKNIKTGDMMTIDYLLSMESIMSTSQRRAILKDKY